MLAIKKHDDAVANTSFIVNSLTLSALFRHNQLVTNKTHPNIEHICEPVITVSIVFVIVITLSYLLYFAR